MASHQSQQRRVQGYAKERERRSGRRVTATVGQWHLIPLEICVRIRSPFADILLSLRGQKVHIGLHLRFRARSHGSLSYGSTESISSLLLDPISILHVDQDAIPSRFPSLELVLATG